MLWAILAMIALVAAQILLTPTGSVEGFVGSSGSNLRLVAGAAAGPETDLASVQMDLPLQDFLKPAPQLNTITVEQCAAEDASLITELGGSYVQRTNNFRHSYPDNCSAPLTEFVSSVYAPRKHGVGAGVGCADRC